MHVQDGEVNSNGALRNVFLFVRSEIGNRHFPLAGTPVVLDQQGCIFVPGAAPFYKKFAHPEIMISVSCNVHPRMKAYIGVVDNPSCDVTRTKGRFTIKGAPANEYTIEAWTASFGTQEKKVLAHLHQTGTLDFRFRQQ